MAVEEAGCGEGDEGLGAALMKGTLTREGEAPVALSGKDGVASGAAGSSCNVAGSCGDGAGEGGAPGERALAREAQSMVVIYEVRGEWVGKVKRCGVGGVV